MKHGDLAFGGATLVIGVAYYFMATAVPVSRLADAIGPQGLPKVYALMLVALSLILVLASLRKRFASRSPRGSEARERPAARSLLRAVGMLVIGAAYIVVVPWLGYLLAISVLIFATTYYQGGTIGRNATLVALCGGVFVWLLFVVMMGIAQPPGFFRPPR